MTSIKSASEILSNGSYDAAGVVVSGGNSTGYQNEQAACIVNGQSNFSVDGLTVKNNKNSGLAFIKCTNGAISNLTVSDNGPNGLGFVDCKNMLVRDSIIQRNNLGVDDPGWKNAKTSSGDPAAILSGGKYYADPGNEGGNGKDFENDGLTYLRVWFKDTVGVNRWLDAYNKNVHLEACWFTGAKRVPGIPDGKNLPGNRGWENIGLGVEIDYGPISTKSCYFDKTSRLAIQESQLVTSDGDTFDGSGIEFRSLGGRPVAMGKGTITDGKFVNGATITGAQNAVGKNITFTGCEADTQATVDLINSISTGGCKLVPTSSIAIPTTPPGPGNVQPQPQPAPQPQPVPPAAFPIRTNKSGHKFQRIDTGATNKKGVQIQLMIAGASVWKLLPETANVKNDGIAVGNTIDGMYWQQTVDGTVYGFSDSKMTWVNLPGVPVDGPVVVDDSATNATLKATIATARTKAQELLTLLGG